MSFRLLRLFFLICQSFVLATPLTIVVLAPVATPRFVSGLSLECTALPNGSVGSKRTDTMSSPVWHVRWGLSHRNWLIHRQYSFFFLFLVYAIINAKAGPVYADGLMTIYFHRTMAIELFLQATSIDRLSSLSSPPTAVRGLTDDTEARFVHNTVGAGHALLSLPAVEIYLGS
jgi:hypothetical protein